MEKRKILHVGNILNNGYINCKYLRRRGIEADSLNVDYKHVQGQPEWEDLYIEEPVSEWNQDWSKINLGSYRRPEWFYDVSLQEIPDLALRLDGAAPGKVPVSANTTLGFPRKSSYVKGLYSMRSGVSGMLRRAGFSRLVNSIKCRNSINTAKQAGISADEVSQRLNSIIREFTEEYPERNPVLTLNDIHDLLPRSLAYTPIFQKYPLIQAYALDPIYVMLGDPGKPFICFEHGTLRDFPFEDSARGRLYALSLKKAESVIITNADCNRSAERLGIDNYAFIPHPVDEEIYKPEESKVKRKIVKEHKCDLIFLAPARHHWKNCPQGLENSWFKRNDVLIRALGNVFKKYPDLNALVIFFEWGQEVDFSKRLIDECGFSNKVRWEPVRSKRVIKEFYNACDVVFDQFNSGIGTFGSVVPEALACAKPVILNYKKDLHNWCYPELPPLLHAPDEEAIEKCTLDLVRNKSYRLNLGERGREWFLKYHSSKIVTGRMIDIYRSISEKYNWGWEF